MRLKTLAVISIAIGAIYGCVVLKVAFGRNHSGAFFDMVTGAPHFGTILLLFLMVLAQVSLVVFALGALIRWAVRHWRQHPQP